MARELSLEEEEEVDELKEEDELEKALEEEQGESDSDSNQDEFPDTSITVAHVTGET